MSFHPTLTPPAFTSRVVPVIVITDVAQAVPLAHALLAGGVDVMEITLRHAAGLPAIEAVASAVPQMHVGAGTVTHADEVRRVQDAGASFALSPGMTDALVQAAFDARLPFMPGVMTPGEVMRARDHGFRLVKLFPAELVTPSVVKAMRAVLPQELKLLPVGGITPETMAPYRKAGAAGFGLGSALYAPGMTGEEVGRRARAFAEAWQRD